MKTSTLVCLAILLVSAYAAVDCDNVKLMYRSWGHNNHFYTDNPQEWDTATHVHKYAKESVACALASTQVEGSVPLYRWYKHAVVDHHYTADENENARMPGHGYAAEGIIGYCFPTQVEGTVPLYRSWNGGIADHFFTVSQAEHNNAVPHGWGKEGVACYVYPSDVCFNRHVGETLTYNCETDLQTVYRSWNAGLVDHFYTHSADEQNNAANNGWAKEGDLGKGFNKRVPGSIPWYRLWQAQHHNHFYTSDPNEWISAQVKHQYQDEGITTWMSPEQVEGTGPVFRSYKQAGSDHFYTMSEQESKNAVSHGWAQENSPGNIFPADYQCPVDPAEQAANTPNPCGNNCVALWSECYYQGNHKCLCDGAAMASFAGSDFENFEIYSMQVPDGFTLDLFGSKNYEGDCVKTYDANQLCLAEPVRLS